MLLFILLGITAGSIAASINSFKDAPYENFSWLKFFRSFVLGSLVGLLYYYFYQKGLVVFENLGILLLAMIPAERVSAEMYKGFIKTSHHFEYVHALNRLGLPHNVYFLKLILAIPVLAILIGIVAISTWIASNVLVTGLPFILKGIIIGFFAPMTIAIGGGVKDSQFEGFDIKKFFRTPLVGIFAGTFLLIFTEEPVLLVMSTIGLERTLVECYKTFITRRVRGVHQGKSIQYPEWHPNKRWVFFLPWSVSVIIIFTLLFSGVVVPLP